MQTNYVLSYIVLGLISMYLQLMKPSLTLPLRTITFKSQVSMLSEEIDNSMAVTVVGCVCNVKSKLNFKIREDLVNNDLVLLFIQISNPHSKPFLVGT